MFKIRNIEKNDIPRLVLLEEELLKETVGEEMLGAELHNKFARFYVATFNLRLIIIKTKQIILQKLKLIFCMLFAKNNLWLYIVNLKQF